MRDCNDCEFLNITEKEQNKIYEKIKKKSPHYCEKYNKKVIHKYSSNKEHNSKIYPCEECNNANKNNYDFRGKRLDNR